MIGLIFVSLPVIVYLAAAMSVRRQDASSPTNFFTAHKKANITVFSTSSIAYAFQMSTIFPFLIWGAGHFLFLPVVNTVFWGLGIYIFHLALRRRREFVAEDQSLHGFLGQQYNPSVRKVASYLTIIGCLGFSISELYFGSQVLIAILQGRWSMYLLILLVSIVVYIYVAYGGQLSSMRTDQLQLAISYLGFFGIILYFLFVINLGHRTLDASEYVSLVVCIILIPLILLRRAFTFLSISFGGSVGRVAGRVLNWMIVLVLLAIVGLEIPLLFRGISGRATRPFFDLTGFGLPGVLSLTILPLCFQFVDLTNWQRLLSVKPTAEDTESLQGDIGRGLLTYALESPFTWLISLFFGLLATRAVTGVDTNSLLIDLPHRLLQSTSHVQHLVAYTFILSVISVMLSTVDSFMVGIIYTFTYDSYGPTQRLLDTKNDKLIKQSSRRIINTGRVFGIIALVVGLCALLLFDRLIPAGGDLFVNLLLSFYSAQLSFFPLVFGTLYLAQKPTALWANISMISGALVGIAFGIYSVIWKPEYAWYPILLCFGISSCVYAVGYFASSHRSQRIA